MDGDWIQAGVAFVAVAAVAGWGLRPVGDRLLHRWERRFCLAVPDDLRGEAAGALRRRRATRSLAIAAGLLVATAPLYVNLIVPERAGDVASPATGHGLRTLRDRPMAAPDGPRRQLDEALRADGAHHIVGASVALAAASAAGAVSLAFDSRPVVGAAAQLLATAALGLWWAMVRDVRWSVTARRRLAAAAGTRP